MALYRNQISAVLVSRELIDPRILKSLEGFGEIIIANGIYGPYARYDEAVTKAKFDIIYTQDDDCLVNVNALLELWNGNFVANVMPDRLEPCFNNNTLIGWGALFRKELALNALNRYAQKYGKDALYRRESDRIVPGLNPHPLVSVGATNLPNATGPNRLCDQPDHLACREEIRRRLETL